jgi:hypothetical protein
MSCLQRHWPPDMGYWLSYRIAQTFYDQAADQTAALRTLLLVTDFKAFLAGYRERSLPALPT